MYVQSAIEMNLNRTCAGRAAARRGWCVGAGGRGRRVPCQSRGWVSATASCGPDRRAADAGGLSSGSAASRAAGVYSAAPEKQADDGAQQESGGTG